MGKDKINILHRIMYNFRITKLFDDKVDFALYDIAMSCHEEYARKCPKLHENLFMSSNFKQV